MGRWQNNETGAVVSVADEKDERFDDGWTSLKKGETPRTADERRAAAEKKAAAATKPEKSETPDDSWTIKELTAHAEENSIDLGDAKKKPDIIAAIAAAAGAGE